MNRSKRLTQSMTVVAGMVAAGCGGRPASWDTPPDVQAHVGLSRSFALLDEATHVAQLMTVQGDLSLTPIRQPMGVDLLNAKASTSGDRLFVLTQGVQPRRKASDERPALWVYDGTGSGQLLAQYTLADPLGGLALDPEGKFVVVYASGTSGTFIENPNELVVIDVTKPPSDTNPQPRTLRSFGGRPRRLTFTPSLSLPAGDRRLLLIETDQDVSILDLDHLDRKEVTVKLSDQLKIVPAGLVFTDGSPSRNDDTHIAIRTSNESSVYLLTLGPQNDPKANNDFAILINIVGLSSTPSDFAFVNTDGGLRLAMLEPGRRTATLADPDTTVTTTVDMPAPYGRIALVTSEVSDAPASGSDVALLWGGGPHSATGVAFWSLGKSVGQSYRSIETLPDVASSVSEVVNVPAPNDALKILVPNQVSPGGQFHVLNLAARTASPLQTAAYNLKLTVSSDGQRAWFYEPGARNLALVDLSNLHPQNMLLDRPIVDIFDLARTDGGRAVVALHDAGTWGATLLDAFTPDETATVGHVGLLQGGY